MPWPAVLWALVLVEKVGVSTPARQGRFGDASRLVGFVVVGLSALG
jgi:hypothetical protein